jgi:hypothetical protein
MKAVCGDKCVDVSTVRRWVWQFKEEEVEEANVCDKARSEKGGIATDESREERADEMISIEAGRDYVEE